MGHRHISSISFLIEPLISWSQRWTFLDHFCHNFWVGATAKQQQTHPKVMTKMVKKCSTLCSIDQSFIRKRNTTYRVHTLAYFLNNMTYFGSQCVALSSIGSSTKPKRTHNICMLNVDYEIYRNFKAVIMVARLGVIICWLFYVISFIVTITFW